MKKFFLILIFLVGLVFSPAILGILLLLSSFWLDGKKVYLCLAFFCVLTGLIFLDIVPGYGLDFDRYMQTTTVMHYINFKGIGELINFYHQNADNESKNLLFILIQYIVSRFNYPNLLSFVSVSLSSFFAFFPFVDIIQRKKEYRFCGLILALIAFFILGYGYMGSVMRWSLAVTSCVFTNYIYFFVLDRDKKWLFILFIPILFHLGIVLGVLISLLVALKRKQNILTLIGFVGFTVLFLVTSGNSTVGNGIMGQLMTTTRIYSTNFLASTDTTNAIILNFVMYFVYIMLIIVDVLIRQAGKARLETQFSQLAMLTVISTIILASRHLILVRFIPLACFFISLDIFLLLTNSKINISLKKNLGLLISTFLLIDFLMAAFFELASFNQFAFPVSGIAIWFKSIIFIITNTVKM